MQLKDALMVIIFGVFVSLPSQVIAAEYKLDIKGAHAFIQFKIQHLGYSWIIGQFNKFDGKLKYDFCLILTRKQVKYR